LEDCKRARDFEIELCLQLGKCGIQARNRTLALGLADLTYPMILSHRQRDQGCQKSPKEPPPL
jgi:hypothetical protein